MTFSRDYTLAEIDAMRGEVAKKMLIGHNGTTSVADLNRLIEDRLRTYMMAGVTLADLRGGVVKEADPFEVEEATDV